VALSGVALMAVKKRNQSNQSPSSTDMGTDEQYRRFIEAARQAEADEDAENFERRLKQIASVKPTKRRPKRESG
jgi:hypothetical protein